MAYIAGKASESSPLMSTQNADNVNITGGTCADVAYVMSGTTLTPVAAEYNTLTGLPASVTIVTTPASGTCAVQCTFKDSTGTALTHSIGGLMAFTNSTGLAIANATSNAVLTNGTITELKVGFVDFFMTTAAGLLGFTVTASAGSYFATFVLPNGQKITTTALVVN